MGILLTTLTRFVGSAGKAFKAGGALHQVFAGIFRTLRMGLPILTGFIGMIGGAFLGAIGKITSVFTDAIKEALGFELSIKGLLEQAEKARRYWSELGDELSYASDKTGSTAKATQSLMRAQVKSAASVGMLKSAMQGLYDAGVDDKEIIDDLLPQIGDLEVATGLAGTQFSQMMGKFSEIFKKKGIQKDVLALTKAMVGTGLKTQNLEQAMQGALEISEKLAYVTRGQTLDFVNLGKEYTRATAVFKGFGISAQSTQSFISGLMDPENIDKHMLLLNKLGYSYEEFNQMLNTGKGQEVFFDKILNNIGKVASEANMIEDAATRYRYIKDTLGLPPEFASKLLNIEPYRMREEIKKLKQEMEEAEKRKRIKDKLKQREEKYQEQMDFIRFEMVAPLMDLIIKNRGVMKDFMKTMKPVIQGLATMLKEFLTPFSDWFGGFNKDLAELNETIGGLDEKGKAEKIRQFIIKQVQTLADTFVSAFTAVWNSDQMQGVIIPIAKSLGRLLRIAMNYATGNVFGKRTWAEASKNIDDDDKKEKNDDIAKQTGLNFRTARIKKIGDTVYDNATGGTRVLATQQEVDAINAKTTAVYIKELKKNYKNVSSGPRSQTFTEEDYSKLADLLRQVRAGDKGAEVQTIQKIQDMQKKLYNINTPEAIATREALKKLETTLNGGFDLRIEPTEPFFKGPGNTLDKNKKQNNSSNPSKQPTVRKRVNSSPSTNNFRDIPQLDKPNQLSVNPGTMSTPGDYSNKDFQTLNKSNDPFLKLLNEFKVGVLGESPKNGSAMSIKELLFDISENLSDTESKDKSKLTFNQANASITKVATTNPTGNELMPSIGLSGYVESTALKQIAASSVKNLSVRQTLYLKAIAEATFSTAYHIKNIASGLIFTKYGLATYDQTVATKMPSTSSFGGYQNLSTTGVTTSFNPLGISGGAGRNITASGTLLGY